MLKCRRKYLAIAFRFGVEQMDISRSRDDLKYSTTNLYCTVWTPIKLPTWDHIAQISLRARPTNEPWAFFKTDHEAAYKQLPLDPTQANLAMVALRHPTLRTWFVFAPRSLIFGSVAAVIHYNCFSRIISVLTNKIFGIPLLAYFDDLGSEIPERVAPQALKTFQTFSALVGYLLKLNKTDIGREVTFLGLLGKFPTPENDMTLEISLSPDKVTSWSDRIDKFLELGVITPTELDSLIGRLSFSQTSIFGRFGRPFLAHLYAKQNAPYYSHILSDREQRSLRWWCTMLRQMKPRKITPKPDKPEYVVFTDAATKTGIMAAIVIERATFGRTNNLSMVWEASPGPHWNTLFDKTSLIYGLEMLAFLALLWTPDPPFRGKTVTFHLDNENAVKALIKNNAKPDIITAMTHLAWFRLYQLDVTPWFEWVPSNRNIADLPTRRVKLPFKTLNRSEFKNLRDLYDLIKQAVTALQTSRNIPMPKHFDA